MHSILDKTTVSVLVVEPASSVRLMLTDVLKELEFTQVQGVASSKEALNLMEVEPVDWLVMPLMASEPLDAISILKTITLEPRLRRTACSLLLDPSEEDYALLPAFELGLLSWHKKTYARDALRDEFEDLIKRLGVNGGDATLTAASYVREVLTTKRFVASRLSLEENLLALYPGSARQLIHFAEAELLTDKTARGHALLDQAALIDEGLAPISAQLKSKYPPKPGVSVDPLQENVLGVKRAILIDPDTDVLYAAAESLARLGVKQVEQFEDGQAAFDWLATGQEADLIFMEWRITGLSGPVLVQRFRQGPLLHVPIIVMSSLVKKEERPLLKEMGVDELIVKPFDQTTFLAATIWTLQQNRAPTEQKSLERKIRRLLATGKSAEVERLIAQMLSDPRIQEGSKSEIKAEYAFFKGDFRGACEFGVEALRFGGDSLMTLNLVGKSLMKLGEYARALKCFEKADSLSSMNIERLLNVADASLQLGRKKEASQALGAASLMDPMREDVREITVKVHLETGNVEAASAAMVELESVQRIAAYINNRAITLARSGRFEEGIALYRRALQCLAAAPRDLQTAVSYNLALAHVRYGDNSEAAEALRPIVADPSLPIFKKAASLLKRIEDSLASGRKILLEADQKDVLPLVAEGSGVADLDRLTALVTAKRGDLGCYMIFFSQEKLEPKATALLAKPLPRFARRDAIQRQEAMPRPAGRAS